MKRAPKGKGGTALPWSVTKSIVENINTARDRYRKVMTTWDMPMSAIMEHLFTSEVLEICKRGYEVCSDYNRRGNESYILAPGINLPRTECLNALLPNKILASTIPVPGLEKYRDEVRDIYNDYQLVEDIFEWFNNNTSVGAMRAYCPWVCSLTTYDDWGTGAYREPQGLGPMVHKIRLAAEIMARSLLIQQVPEKPKLGYSLYFTSLPAFMIYV